MYEYLEYVSISCKKRKGRNRFDGTGRLLLYYDKGPAVARLHN